MYDRIILGAGIYGMYSAVKSAKAGHSVLVIETDSEPFMRGSYINQARLHNGYHYPRSYSTAAKCAKYFDRFFADFNDCILQDFSQIYAVATHYSWTNGKQFANFCDNVVIRCDEISDITPYFNPHTVEKAFATHEYTFDAQLISACLLNEAKSLGVSFAFDETVIKIFKKGGNWQVYTSADKSYISPWVLNSTYASINEIHRIIGFEPLNYKYELCEVILCNVSDNIAKVGLTVMDGPFFSVMPFGKTGYHSLTTVSKTPHITSYEKLPTFPCQGKREDCTPETHKNCNICPQHPPTAFAEMYQTAKKYMNHDIKIEYVKSLYTLKPILKASEIDDSRPTIIRQYSAVPDFYSVFSGKINTIYDLDGILE
jgi:glycine/D-amino acid oxidase-like deaminating enzyme